MRRSKLAGIADLDRQLGPIEPGNLIVIAARPRNGKTIAAAQWGEHMARSGRGVLFVSAEMSELEINKRRVLSESGISQERIDRGLASPTITRSTLSARPSRRGRSSSWRAR